MNGLQPFESTNIEQTTETMPPSHKTVTAAVMTANRITSLQELLHCCNNITLNKYNYAVVINNTLNLTLCSSRKYPYSPHRRDWNFLGGAGFCMAKKLKEMYEAYLEFPEG